jgi:hypothetical protein
MVEDILSSLFNNYLVSCHSLSHVKLISILFTAMAIEGVTLNKITQNLKILYIFTSYCFWKS